MFPVNFSQTNMINMKALGSNIGDARIEGYSGFLVFHLESSWQNVLLIFIMYTLAIGTVIFITYKIKQIFSNFENEKNFIKSNVNHLRVIAMVILVIPVIQYVFTSIANNFFQNNLVIDKIVTLYPSFNYSLLITALILFALIELFKLGIELEEESKLTI